MKLEIGSRKHSERLMNKPTDNAFTQIQPMAGLQIGSERYMKLEVLEKEFLIPV